MTIAKGLAAAGLVLLFSACRDETPRAEQRTEAAISQRTEENLARFSRGAVVARRTGELRLDASSLHAVDDYPDSGWVTPPKDPAQSMTIALPVRSVIDRVGLIMGAGKSPASVTFEHSLDGRAFEPLAALASPPGGRETIERVDPTTLSWLRVTISESGLDTVTINDISAYGKEEGSFDRPELTGAWSVNGKPASFAQERGRVRGIIETEPPTLIEGGWSDRLILFIYMRGNEHGLGGLAVSPDGTRLNGIWWYEKVKPVHIAPVWFGEKSGDGAVGRGDWEVTAAWLSRFGWAPLPGLLFDPAGALQADASAGALDRLEMFLRSPQGATATLRKRDLTQATPEEGRASSARALDALRSELARRGVDLSRVTFQPLGAEGLEDPSTGPVAHAILNTVEIVVEKAP